MKTFALVFAGVLAFFLGGGVGVLQMDTASAQEKIPVNHQLPDGVQYPDLSGEWTGYWSSRLWMYTVKLTITGQEQAGDCPCRKISGTISFTDGLYDNGTFPLEDAALWFRDGGFTLRFVIEKGPFEVSATNGLIKGYVDGKHHMRAFELKRAS